MKGRIVIQIYSIFEKSPECPATRKTFVAIFLMCSNIMVHNIFKVYRNEHLYMFSGRFFDNFLCWTKINSIRERKYITSEEEGF